MKFPDFGLLRNDRDDDTADRDSVSVESFYCRNTLLDPTHDTPSSAHSSRLRVETYFSSNSSPSLQRFNSLTSRKSTSSLRIEGEVNRKTYKMGPPTPTSSTSKSTSISSKEPKEKSRLLDHFPILKENGLMMKSTKGFIIPATERPKSALIGKLAPDFVLNDHLNRKCSLHATIALGRPIVLFFFPLAGSPHCTIESCSFRDAIGTSPIFNDLEAIVIGISQDPPSRSKKFVDEHHLGYRILHDEDRDVMERWGVKKVMLGLLDSRCTFVIDNNGIVRGMAEGFFDSIGHRVFAERWLTRIEHELSGRIRRVEEVPTSAGDLIMANDEQQAKTRVIYGAERSAAGGGIGGVPRYGAAPSSQKLSESQLANEKQRKAGFKALLGNLTSAGVVDARDELEQLEISGSSSSSSSNRFANSSGSGWSRGRMASAKETPSAKWSPLSPDSVSGGSLRTTNSDGNSIKGKRASWKSLSNRPRSSSNSTGGAGAFSRSRRHQEALREPLPGSPGIPPTYQNVDTDETQFSQVDRFTSSHLQQSRSRTEADQNRGLGIQAFNRGESGRSGSIRRPPGSSGSNEVQYIARVTSNEKFEDPRTPRSISSTNHDASTWATRSSASSQSASTADTSVGSHGRSRAEALKREKEKAEYDANSAPLPLLPPSSRHQTSLPPPGRPSRGPYDVPRDAEEDEDDDNEEFVALNANGELELTGRRKNGSDGSGNTIKGRGGASSHRPGTTESSASSKRAHSRSNSTTSSDGMPLRPQDFARTYPKDEARDHLVLADGSKLGPPILPSVMTVSPSPSFTELETSQVKVARRIEAATNTASPVVGRVVNPSLSRNSSTLISPRPGAPSPSPQATDSLSRHNTPTNETSRKVSIESIRSNMLSDDDLGHSRMIPKKNPPPTYAPPPAPSPNSSPMLNPINGGQFQSSSSSSSQIPSSSPSLNFRSWAEEDPFSSSSSTSRNNNQFTRSPQSTSRSSTWDSKGISSSNSSGSSNTIALDNRRPSNVSIRSTGTFGVQHIGNGNGSTFQSRNGSVYSDVSESSEDGIESSTNSRPPSFNDKEKFARSAMNGISAL